MIRIMLLSVVLATWSEGRIGDTLEECKARYGEPVEVLKALERYQGALSGWHVFRFGELEATAMFDKDGRCILITYKKPVGEPRFLVKKLSQEERSHLLVLNGAGQNWSPREGKSEKDVQEHITEVTIGEAWEREDGKILAWYKEQGVSKNKGDVPARLMMSVLGFRTAGYDALLQELNRKDAPEPSAD